MQEKTRERLNSVMELTRKSLHIAFIPLIIYLGYTNSVPRPSLFRLISPLAG
ncbi:hypothetical protein CXG81DRAFT_26749 [Caulochytrium protostelioides]|uniref:Tom7-domain-containing protein n=1 Tax=Caulochytrium protostelioides TaxID=1555241 RepID=A0A4P9X5X7_9FUNG|nr:hypothetical protein CAUPRSCDRAFT_7487 [Caulochytrium protostelioides]RKP00566.1 hypothetical protein CXG81DRAFT_26749 [Caulochytrium protostelioides]|eukprot:RKP00566.1 hypothetical protein CXG81DRAFT_26749 [Caulochytrium protostelioides]